MRYLPFFYQVYEYMNVWNWYSAKYMSIDVCVQEQMSLRSNVKKLASTTGENKHAVYIQSIEAQTHTHTHTHRLY